jgi:hypothetical protein
MRFSGGTLLNFGGMPFAFYEADKGGAGSGSGDNHDDNDDKGKKKDERTWETVLAGLPAEDQALFESHVLGLKTSLAAERKINKDNTPRLKKLEEFETNAQKLEEEQKSELQKAQEALKTAQDNTTKLQADFSAQRIKTEVRVVAGEMLFINPNDAATLADLSSVVIEGDEVKGVKEALEALKKERPYLIKTSDGDGKGNPPRGLPKPKTNEPKGEKPQVVF